MHVAQRQPRPVHTFRATLPTAASATTAPPAWMAHAFAATASCASSTVLFTMLTTLWPALRVCQEVCSSMATASAGCSQALHVCVQMGWE